MTSNETPFKVMTMYESQEQISTRDAFELGLIAAAMPMADDHADEAERQLALSMGFDPFSGLTVEEFFMQNDALAGV